ncbi:high-affinity nickel-transport protein [Pseudarthrobacter siccitolerans]|uniref:Nickel/cobalt efflux system n=1 Tax=Pseudarthrobacter siccitolerans TaxID=861266 RepID=A0ABU0PIK8_9MICC|nr:HoxN/HupN/NixA family nickel/cobalt transporter [Pseudarthrobacter siccitolerans]MDQ0673793.1 high-affinity nickel-transport protein [Pseudarthrobacter siccitolerans]
MGILAALDHAEPAGSGFRGGKRGSAVTAMAVTIIVLHLVGWGVLVFSIVPQNLHIGPTQVFGVGIGAGAYLLGMRHAFDVDHIAAIDCTTRKLIGEGHRPLSVGFWFSLGHSSIVCGLCALLATGAHYLGGMLGENTSPLRDALGLAGSAVSGVFLYLLAALNVLILLNTVADLRGARDGRPPGPRDGAPAGLMARILRPVMRSITKPWQMYLVGLLFGLGFDTATEVALLVVAVGTAATALPWYAILILPTLFAAGMCLFDTLDGWFMNLAYGRAYSSPERRLKYNAVLTGLSAVVALTVGTAQMTSLAAVSLDLTGLGYAVVGLFVLVWLAAVCAGRFHGGRKPGLQAGRASGDIASAKPGD